MNQWQPDTSPMSSATIRAWRKQQKRTEEECAARAHTHIKHPTQREMAGRMGISLSRYRRAERHGVRGCAAALFRVHMETGETISTVDAPLEYWEALANHCGSYIAALSLLGLSPVPGRYACWEICGAVRSSYGAGRLLRICWERMGLENAKTVRRGSQPIDRKTINRIKQLRRQGHTFARIASMCGVGWNTAKKYGRSV